jgi:glycosyltransferase involved in cell wall biosynthesis
MSFGIVIPIYNSQKYIEKCIESVLNQTYKKIQIYLINDNSEDNSLQIIQKYLSDKNIKLFNNTENIGKYKSVNQILKQINTDYFLILDSQDKLLLNRLEIENDLFKNNKSLFVIQSKVKKIDEIKNKIVTDNIYNYNSETYRSDILKKIGFFNENRFGGNLEYFARAKKFMETEKIYNLNKILTESILRDDKKNLCFIYSIYDTYNFLKKIKKNHKN